MQARTVGCLWKYVFSEYIDVNIKIFLKILTFQQILIKNI
jgi:hypothetical protein